MPKQKVNRYVFTVFEMDKVVHFEIPAENTERAKKFYKDNFNWEITPFSGMNYNIVRTGPTSKEGMPDENGFINGGILARNDTVGSPVIVMSVANIMR